MPRSLGLSADLPMVRKAEPTSVPVVRSRRSSGESPSGSRAPRSPGTCEIGDGSEESIDLLDVDPDQARTGSVRLQSACGDPAAHRSGIDGQALSSRLQRLVPAALRCRVSTHDHSSSPDHPVHRNVGSPSASAFVQRGAMSRLRTCTWSARRGAIGTDVAGPVLRPSSRPRIEAVDVWR